MILFPDFEDFIKLLNTHSVDYMVVGGYALAFHGKPRNTGDLDIWIEISETNAKKLLQVLDDFGFGNLNFKKEDFTKPGYITQIGYPPLRIDILNNLIIRFFASKSKSFMEIGSNSNIPALFRLRSAVFQPLTCGKFAYWQKSVYPY